jgi:hypothetical protein
VWTWLLGSYAVVLLVITGCAAYVALALPDAEHRKDGYRVLKLVLGLVTGISGLIAAVVRLHETGLI